MKTSQIDRGLTRSVAVSRRHANSPVPSNNPAVLSIYILRLEKVLIARLGVKGRHKKVDNEIALALRKYLSKLAKVLRQHQSLIKAVKPILLKEWDEKRWNDFVQLWVFPPVLCIPIHEHPKTAAATFCLRA